MINNNGIKYKMGYANRIRHSVAKVTTRHIIKVTKFIEYLQSEGVYIEDNQHKSIYVDSYLEDYKDDVSNFEDERVNELDFRLNQQDYINFDENYIYLYSIDCEYYESDDIFTDIYDINNIIRCLWDNRSNNIGKETEEFVTKWILKPYMLEHDINSKISCNDEIEAKYDILFESDIIFDNKIFEVKTHFHDLSIAKDNAMNQIIIWDKYEANKKIDYVIYFTRENLGDIIDLLERGLVYFKLTLGNNPELRLMINNAQDIQNELYQAIIYDELDILKDFKYNILYNKKGEK